MRYSFMLVALLLAGQVVAQQLIPTNPTQPVDPARRTDAPGVEPRASENARTGTDRDLAAGKQDRVLRASEIIGTNVKNKANEGLGSINDLVINPMDGRITYAAVSMGGFLGVGDKLFAVPWDAIECRKVNDEHVAILDVNKQSLENAKGFDQDNWPDFANEQWRTENDRPYKSTRPRAHEVYRPVQQPDAQPQPRGQQLSGQQQAPPTQPRQQ